MRFPTVTLFFEKCRQSVTSGQNLRQARYKPYHTFSLPRWRREKVRIPGF